MLLMGKLTISMAIFYSYVSLPEGTLNYQQVMMWNVIYNCKMHLQNGTWWLIPLSKWAITPVINGIFVGLIHL